MSHVRVPPRAVSQPKPAEEPGAREAKLSRRFLWWLLAAPFVGFALAGRVLKLTEGDWETWKAAVLGLLMMAPFAVGAYVGLRSVLKRVPRRLGRSHRQPHPCGGRDRDADSGVADRLKRRKSFTAHALRGSGVGWPSPPGPVPHHLSSAHASTSEPRPAASGLGAVQGTETQRSARSHRRAAG